MNFQLQGKLTEIFDTQQVTDSFQKREFIVETKEENSGKEFIETIKFQLTGDKCNILDTFVKGEDVEVSFNIRGRVWRKDDKVSYFTNLEAWRVSHFTDGQVRADMGNQQESLAPEDDINDLPY